MPRPPHLLWLDESQQRYFLIPQGYPLPKGTFVIAPLDGQAVATTAKAVAKFAVDEEEAAAWLAEHWQAQLHHLLDQLPAALEPAALLNLFQQLLGGALAQDEAAIEATATQLATLQAQLRAQGVEPEIDLATLPHQLQGWVAAMAEEEGMREAGAWLAELAGTQDETRPPDEQIDEAIGQLEALFDKLIPYATRHEARFKAAQAARIQAGVEADLAAGMRAQGLDQPLTFNFDALRGGTRDDEPPAP